MLLLLGAALGATLLLQVWRLVEVEQQARRLEREHAEALAERILQQAREARAVMEQVDPASRFTLRAGRVEADDGVGWLFEAALPGDDDPVVLDRLDRAAVAEFAGNDPAAARRAFDELLAAALPHAQRLQAVAAASWLARRQDDRESCCALDRELDDLLLRVQPADLARPAIHRAVAAALRLPRSEPGSRNRLLPFLPPAAIAGIPLDAATARRHHAIVARRSALREADARLSTLDAPASSGLLPLPGGRLLWWLPGPMDTGDAATLRPEQWLDAVQAAGRTSALPQWPWQIEVDLGSDPAVAFAGVPFVRGLRPSPAFATGQRPWLLPVATLVLLAAFAIAVGWQFRAARRERDAVRAQAEFVTTVTHELKTPLASIRLLGEMLLEGRALGRERDYYGMLAGEAARLSMLIENVLDLGRIERGARSYDLRPLDAATVVRDTVALLAPLGDRIAVHAPAAALPVRTDRAALVQTLIAVLDNARKYGREPVSIAVARATPHTVAIHIRDHGPGVPTAERERIFARFTRGSAHQHGSTPGVGIGLYLARTIARRLGGDLVCQSPADGPGAEFVLTLPTETDA